MNANSGTRRQSMLAGPGISRTRPLDYILCGYYVYQVLCTTLFDSQGVYPRWWYPSWLRAVYTHYLDIYRDPFLGDAWKYPWYLSICLVEHFVGIPFFIWAVRSYYHGVLNRHRIIIPSIICSSYTIASVIAVWAMALIEDFSRYADPAPRTLFQRLLLCAIYWPMFIFSFINLIDSYSLAAQAKLKATI